jgi:hypothetical protein
MLKIMRFVFFALILIAVISFNSIALEPGVKTIGLGNAYNAVADDNSAIELNPGGLAQVKHYEIDVNYLFSDYSQQWRFSVLDSVSSSIAMGLAYSQIQFKDDAEHPFFAEVGVPSLSRAQNTTIAMGSGSDYLYAGVNASYQKIKENPRDYFWTFSAGAILKPVPQLLNLSFTIYNFATAGADNHSVKQKLSAGASTFVQYVLASVEWSRLKEPDANDIWSFGIEGYLPQQIVLRSGYFRGKTAQEEGYGAGLSWRVQQLALNYSFQKRHNDKLNSISVSIFLF